TATAALASPGPIAAASSAPVTAAGNSRRLPSGRVTATGLGRDRPGGPDEGGISSRRSLIMPCAPYMVPFGRGENGHEKTPSVAGGVRRGPSDALNQRARPPDTPPAGVVVVVAVRPMPLMPRISRPARAASRQVLVKRAVSAVDPAIRLLPARHRCGRIRHP